jgi:hypothetical protein
MDCLERKENPLDVYFSLLLIRCPLILNLYYIGKRLKRKSVRDTRRQMPEVGSVRFFLEPSRFRPL